MIRMAEEEVLTFISECSQPAMILIAHNSSLERREVSTGAISPQLKNRVSRIMVAISEALLFGIVGKHQSAGVLILQRREERKRSMHSMHCSAYIEVRL